MPATRIEGQKSKKDKFELAVSRLSDLPTIPNTLLRIWELAGDPDSSASELEKVVNMDQALTAKIIRLVNSPYYGMREPVTSCRHAIVILGFDAVKSLSICVSVVSACMPDANTRSALDLRELWKHSITAGVVAERIALHVASPDPDFLFTAGVLHDIGKFVMNLALGSEYAGVLALARSRRIFLRDAEEEEMGADHAYFGALLARLWGFPENLREIIEHHHLSAPPNGPVTAVEMVSIANTIARVLGVGSSGDDVVPTSADDVLARIGLVGEDAVRFLDGTAERVREAREMMNLVG